MSVAFDRYLDPKKNPEPQTVTETRSITDPKTGKVERVKKTRKLTAKEKNAAKDPNTLYTCEYNFSGLRTARLLNWMCSHSGQEGIKAVLDDKNLENVNWTDDEGSTALW
jgi:hypothetical protein